MKERLHVLRERLAGDRLGFADIVGTGRALLAPGDAPDSADGPMQRIAVAGSVTTDLLACAIGCALVQEGVHPIVHQAPFGAYVQEVLDTGSGLHRFRPELVVLAVDWHELAEDFPPDTPDQAVQEWLDAKVALFERLWTAIRTTLGARIVQHTFVPPVAHLRGPADRLSPSSPQARAEALNARLMHAGAGHAQFVELDRLAAELGLRAWAAERYYVSAKLPFDPRFLPDYVPAFRGAWRAANARAKKVLVLDLDNTLWGGVIGDDGLDGIVLGPGSASGEAFHAWGRYVQALRARGVVLAVCSKNDPEIAARAFEHAYAVLKRSDFAAFECSWSDKPGGLQRIAATLNLGIGAFVFADDNPAECALVRAALPKVGVVGLGTDPAQFIARLDAGHWFDLPRYAAEDFSRNEAYAARAHAEVAREAATDLGAYLRDLAMVGKLYRPGEADRARVAQLEQKTNQFNLTGRRYDEAAVAGFLDDADTVVFALRLADRFGDHGLISTLIAVPEGDALRIASWVMSCRVFSRTAEQYMLRALILAAQQRGKRRILGEFLATPRNGVVADLFPRLGFVRAGDSRWVREVAAGDADLHTEITGEYAI